MSEHIEKTNARAAGLVRCGFTPRRVAQIAVDCDADFTRTLFSEGTQAELLFLAKRWGVVRSFKGQNLITAAFKQAGPHGEA